MFIDEARVYIKGGDGGNGIVAFRREKYVPLGGPSGGDGGRGGSVIFMADEGLNTLIDFKYKRHFKADRGSHGQGKNMHGSRGEDLLVKVPVGTIIKDDDSGRVIADLTYHGQEVVAASGGRGGKGNARFASSIQKAPSFAEKGEPGEEKWLKMELKLLADVGLVGFPNAGKSTLISRISAARPKIADYPFTTLAPNLGVVETKNRSSFVVADIPGIIDGAHRGAGLGLNFLRHIERNRIFWFVLDAAETDGRNVVADFKALRHELGLYKEELLERPFFIVANKMDISGAYEKARDLKASHGDHVFCISAVTGAGIEELVEETFKLLQSLPPEESVIEEEMIVAYEEEPPFEIQFEAGVYEVRGKRIDKLVAMTDLNNQEAVERFQRTIQYMGLEDALKKRGIKNGDTVRISKWEFEYTD